MKLEGPLKVTSFKLFFFFKLTGHQKTTGLLTSCSGFSVTYEHTARA